MKLKRLRAMAMHTTLLQHPCTCCGRDKNRHSNDETGQT